MNKSVWIETLPGGYSVRYYKEVSPGVSRKQREWFKDYNEAQKFKAKKKLQLLAKKQGLTDPTLQPVDVFETYLKEGVNKEGEPFAEETISLKRAALEKYLGTIANLLHLNVRHFYTYLKVRNYSVTTLSIRLREFRAFTNWCIAGGYLDTSPMLMVDRDGKKQKFKIPQSKEAGRKLELTELQAILANIAPRGRLFILFLMYEGSRRLETLNTEWGHINLQDKTWELPKQNVKTRTKRIIPLDDTVIAELLTIPESERTGRLFPGWNKTTPRWYIQKACKKAGIKPDFNPITQKYEYPSPHDFRHSFVSHWTGDPRIVADWVGWKNLAMLKRYSHFNLDNLRNEARGRGIGAKLGQSITHPPKSNSSADMSQTCNKNVTSLLPPSENK